MGLLDGRTAIVTGASSGIGLATARLFAEEGAKVYAVARRRAEGAFAARSLDVRDQPAIARLVADIGRLDVLVYSAGTNQPRRRLAELKPAAWQELIEINLSGAFYFIQAALPLLRRSQGDVILIASISGQWPDFSGPAYQSAKAGLIALARACAFEEHASGIRFSNVNPGTVDTPLLGRRRRRLGREILDLALRPEDVARACLFLVSQPRRVHIPELTIIPTALQALGRHFLLNTAITGDEASAPGAAGSVEQQ